MGIYGTALNNYNNDTNIFYFNPVFKYETKEELDSFVQIVQNSSIDFTTDDIAYWLAIIEVDKEPIANCTSFDAKVFMDYELLQQ